MAILTETWLFDYDTPTIASLSESPFSFFHHSRNSLGGGIGIIIRSNYSLLSSKQLPLKSCEASSYTIKARNESIVKYIVIYRPPSSNFDNFIDEFNTIIIPLIDLYTIITGDFNIHVNNFNCNKSSNFINTLVNNNLKQFIDFPTHQHGNTLDLIITHISSTIIKSVDCSSLFSDHFIINFLVNCSKTPPLRHSITYRKTVHH